MKTNSFHVTCLSQNNSSSQTHPISMIDNMPRGIQTQINHFMFSARGFSNTVFSLPIINYICRSLLPTAMTLVTVYTPGPTYRQNKIHRSTTQCQS